jgi:hypothetical protein
VGPQDQLSVLQQEDPHPFVAEDLVQGGHRGLQQRALGALPVQGQVQAVQQFQLPAPALCHVPLPRGLHRHRGQVRKVFQQAHLPRVEPPAGVRVPHRQHSHHAPRVPQGKGGRAAGHVGGETRQAFRPRVVVGHHQDFTPLPGLAQQPRAGPDFGGHPRAQGFRDRLHHQQVPVRVVEGHHALGKVRQGTGLLEDTLQDFRQGHRFREAQGSPVQDRQVTFPVREGFPAPAVPSAGTLHGSTPRQSFYSALDSSSSSKKAWTTCGSNWLPACRCSSATASAWPRATRYRRWSVMAL